MKLKIALGIFSLAFAGAVLACPQGGGRGGWDRPSVGGGMGGWPRGGNCRHGARQLPAEAALRLNPVRMTAASVDRGGDLYRDNCYRCHGRFGAGDGPDAAGLRVRPANLHHVTRHHADGELAHVIRDGSDPMPAWGDKLSDEEIWHVVNYVRSQFGRGRGMRGRAVPGSRAGGTGGRGCRSEARPAPGRQAGGNPVSGGQWRDNGPAPSAGQPWDYRPGPGSRW